MTEKEYEGTPELIFYCEYNPNDFEDRLEIPFTNEYDIELDFSRDEDNKVCINVDLQPKESNVPKDFFGKNILNVTALAGKNGVGKTNFCKRIFENNVFYYKYDVFSLFKFQEKYYFDTSRSSISTVFFTINSDQSQKNIFSQDEYNNFYEQNYMLVFDRTGSLQEDNSDLYTKRMNPPHFNSALYRFMTNASKKDLDKDIERFYSIFDINNNTQNVIFPSTLHYEYIADQYKSLNDFIKVVHGFVVDDRTSKKTWELADSRAFIRINKFNTDVQKDIYEFYLAVSLFESELQSIKNLERYSRKSNNLRLKNNNISKYMLDNNSSEELLIKNVKAITSELKDILMHSDSILLQNSGIGQNSYKQISSGDLYKSLFIFFSKINMKHKFLTNSFYSLCIDMSKESYCESFYGFIYTLELFILNDNYSYKNFLIEIGNYSAGEKQVLFFVSTLFIQFEDILDNNKFISRSVIIVIDEYEQHLHPEWSRQFLYYLTEFLQSYKNITFQVILTTHSPYLISDLPKENIILLEKDDKIGKRTVRKSNYGFASNYYDIMSDSFFLDDTIGEFAKQKINGCIQAINHISDDLDKLANDELILDDGLSLFVEDSLKIIEEQNQIIDLVGDDVIKKHLQNMKDVVEQRLMQSDVSRSNQERLRKKRAELEKQMKEIDKELNSYD